MGGLVRCQNGHIFSARQHGNVCPYCKITIRDDAGSQIAASKDGTFDEDVDYIGDLEVIDPVTGWLVCIAGPQMGRDYRIMAEKNFIGRAEDMHIQILGDNKIARRNHAIIAYEPHTRKTMILPGDSSGIAYCNGNAVYLPTELKSFSIINMGDSKFAFIPFCGKNFSWTDKEGKVNNAQDT